MGEIVLKNLNRVTKEAMRGEEPRQSKIDKVHNDEQVINHLEPMITEYLVKISHLAITEKEMKVVNNLFDSITDIERSGDHVKIWLDTAAYQRYERKYFRRCSI